MPTGKPYVPNPEHIKLLEEYASCGIPWPGIASLLDAGVSAQTLKENELCKAAYDRGIHHANAQVAGVLFKKALSGDTASMCFWLKCRARWREKDREDVDRVEMTGKDGQPLWGSAHDKLVALASRLIERGRVERAPVDPDATGG